MTNTHFVLKINLIIIILQELDSYYRNKFYDPSEYRNKSFLIIYIIHVSPISSIIFFKDGQLIDIINFGAHLSNETANLDILDKIYVGRRPDFGRGGDITGIVNIIFHLLLF